MRLGLREEWVSVFPVLGKLDQASQELIARSANVIEVPAGVSVFRPGSHCERYLMLLAGRVRVQMVAANGREVVLYRVGAGETCVMTASCLMAHRSYSAEGITETDVVVLGLPKSTFDSLLARSSRFREFALASYAERLSDLVLLVEEVAFQRVDTRLARLLLERAAGREFLSMTHYELAVELGTAREVVSRQLKEFERRGWLNLARGRLDIADRAALEALQQKS